MSLRVKAVQNQKGKIRLKLSIERTFCMGLLTELLVLVLAVLQKSAVKFSDYHQKTLMAII